MSIYQRHKKFDEILAYTYFIQHKLTKQKYHGVRYANIRLNRTPYEDFGVYYFSSGPFQTEFKENPELFEYRLCWTFDTPELAAHYEVKVNLRIIRNSSWLNRSAGKMIINDPETRERIRQKNLGKTPWIKGKKGWFEPWNKGLTLDDYTDYQRERFFEAIRNRKLSDEGRQRMSDSSRERMTKLYSDPNQRKKQSERKKGNKWFNDGHRSYFVKPSEANPLWKPGRILNTKNSSSAISRRIKGTKWYNDGDSNFRLDPSDPRTASLTQGKLPRKNDK